MAKAYRCADCRIVRTAKWTGRCPNCLGFFNIQITNADGEGERPEPIRGGQIVTLDEVVAMDKERVSTGLEGVDFVLGEDRLTDTRGLALKAGHIVQIYGGPGAGKSTLLTQVCLGLAKQRFKVYYNAGEESVEQVKDRVMRVGKYNSKFRVVNESDLDQIIINIEQEEPEVVILDSINTIEVDDYELGSMNAIRIVVKEIAPMAKKMGFALIIVVQITKSGDFSGPKALEHAVDTSLYMRNSGGSLRTLECLTKNRFHKTPVWAHFNMTDKGLVLVSCEDSDSGKSFIDDGKKKSKKKAPAEVSADADADEETIENAIEEILDEALLAVSTARTVKADVSPGSRVTARTVKADASPSSRVTAHTVSTTIEVTNAAKQALTVACDNCNAKVDRACTADNGSREAGFHQSRFDKAVSKLAASSPDHEAEESQKAVEPLKAPGRVTTKKKKVSSRATKKTSSPIKKKSSPSLEV